MNNKILNLKQSFLEKQQTLHNAAKILKTEFVGIDSIIDQVINNVNSWYCFPNLQEKPLIINLWGLTGVGKTSLIQRLAELIDFKDFFYRIDMGKKRGSFSFSNALDELCENKDTVPVIIALDEFQHARTLIGPMRKEIDEDNGRMVWELIDSGKVQYFSWKYGILAFDEYVSKLSDIILEGVKVEKGYVKTKKRLYCKEFDIECKNNEKVLFIPESKYEKIIEFAERRYGLKLKKDLKEVLLAMDEMETISFLFKIIRRAKRPAAKNFSKAIIFVLGNLDEAYTMGSNFNVDIDADEFHNLSLKINIPKIKKALRHRFRDEQISRLGNIHIIYPAFSRRNYEQIIDLQLKKLAKNMYKQTDLIFEFESSISQMIYKEGVYPTQGVRPIYTTINQLIRNNITQFITQIFSIDAQIDTLRFSIENSTLKCKYLCEKQIVDNKEIIIVLSLNELRKPKQDNLQAITAVHESGHAIIGYFLLQSIPEFIYSVTTDSDISGFTYSRLSKEYTVRNQIIQEVAMMLGGYIAEELIFGKENITTGSQSDIDKATGFLSDMYMKNGMGEIPMRISIPLAETSNEYHNYEATEDEIKVSIIKASALARNVLQKEKKLLLVMANYLSTYSSLQKDEIKRIIENERSEKNTYSIASHNYDYRQSIKAQLDNLYNEKLLLAPPQSVVLMNKEIISR